MNKYYCRPIKLYVCLIYRTNNNIFEALLFGYTNGVLLFPVTMPFPTGKDYCGYINNKEYPWLHDWLIEKDIAKPTYHYFIKNSFSYEEFKFKKEK